MKIDWEKIDTVVDKYKERILSLPGVVGISTGVFPEEGDGQPCIRVFLSKPMERGDIEENKLPREIDGVLVDPVVSDEFAAFNDHT